MNNPYQNRPPQMANPGHIPQHYEQRGPIVQKGVPQQKSDQLYHYPQIVIPNQSMPGITPQAQMFQQFASGGNQQPHPAQYAQGNQMYFPPPHPQGMRNGLIPPPQLRQERDHDEKIDQQKVQNIVRQSDEKQNENEIEVRDIVWGEQEQANVFWEQKFFLIYEKFEWFGSRFEMLKSEYISLSEQLLSVDSEDDWNELKRQHEEFAEKLQQMFQQLIAVADENQQLINQRLQQDDGVWQKRYHQLLSNFKALQQKTSMLQIQNQDLKTYQQNDTQQQQGNYPQLLAHYRNLEEEYQKLYTAYNKLQQEYQIVKASPNNGNGPSLEDFENMRMEYQRTLEAIQGENDQLKGDCQGFYQQNEHLKEQLQLQSQAYGETQQLAKALHEKEQLAIGLNSQLQEWKRNYEQLEHQLNELVQRQSAKAQQIIIQLENQLTTTKQQLLTKQSQYVIISKKLQDQLKTKQHLITDHHQQLSKAVKLQSDKHLRQRQTLQNQLKTLQEEYEALLKQSSQKDMNKYQIQAQEKRLTFMKQENQQLLQEIRSKNVELSALRNVSLQLATYENILEQYKALEREKLALQEASRREHSELVQTRKRLSETQHQFSQYKSLTSSSSKKSTTQSQLKHLQNQLSTQQQHTSKLQSQTQKLKQLLQAKQKYIQQLQEQNTKNLIKIEHQDRIRENSEREHVGQVQLLEKRIEGLERRNRTNELEFRTQVVENYQREIKELRHSNQDKLKKIKKLQDSLNQLTARSTHLQRYSSSHNNQLSLLHHKLTTLQSTTTDLLSKLTLSHHSIQSLQNQLSLFKDKQITLKTQLNSYTIQLQQADQLIKNKNNVIADLEQQIKTLGERVDGLEQRVETQRNDKLEKGKKYQDEIQTLKERLYTTSSGNNNYRSDSRRQTLTHHRYSSSYSNRYLSFGPKPLQTQQQNHQITKIQTTIIQQINQQNSKLRQQILSLTQKIHSLESLSRIVAQNLQNSPTKSQQKSKLTLQNHQPTQKELGVMNTYLQERLLKFNQRLQHCIQDNNLIAVRDVDLTASQRIANHQREKRQMEVAYEKQIKTLRDQINALQQQLANQPAPAQAQPQIMDSDIKEFDKYEIMNQHTEKTTAESIEFLRNKLTQQEKTNTILIKLNEQLKKQLEESFQKSSHSTSEYYKLQWKESEKSLEEERQNNKKLSEQNKRLSRQNLEHDTKLMKEYELKIFNIELKLKQVQRQNSYFRLQKAKADNEKANLLHDVNVYSADIETIKSSTESKIFQYEKLANELREKCASLERELYQATNGVKLVSRNSSSRLGSGEKRMVLA